GFWQTSAFTDEKVRKKWGRFAPMGSSKTASGEESFFPDPRWIDDAMLQHAVNRVDQTQNPIVRACYFDLLCEKLRDGKDRKAYIDKAISEYLEAAKVQHANDWMFEFSDSILRAFELALRTKNQARIEVCRDTLFDFLRRLNREG